jgi:hypothetical protein
LRQQQEHQLQQQQQQQKHVPQLFWQLVQVELSAPLGDAHTTVVLSMMPLLLLLLWPLAAATP